jgi:hypothetical protein
MKASEMSLTICKKIEKVACRRISVKSQSQQPTQSPEMSCWMILFVLATRIFTDIEELGHVIAVKSKLLSYLR